MCCRRFGLAPQLPTSPSTRASAAESLNASKWPRCPRSALAATSAAWSTGLGGGSVSNEAKRRSASARSTIISSAGFSEHDVVHQGGGSPARDRDLTGGNGVVGLRAGLRGERHEWRGDKCSRECDG